MTSSKVKKKQEKIDMSQVELRNREHFDGFAYEGSSHYTNPLIIYCKDRKEYLIEGLTHEIIEATIGRLLCNMKETNYTPYFTFNYFQVKHLVTVYSMPYYGIQLQYKNDYEHTFSKYTSKKVN